MTSQNHVALGFSNENRKIIFDNINQDADKFPSFTCDYDVTRLFPPNIPMTDDWDIDHRLVNCLPDDYVMDDL